MKQLDELADMAGDLAVHGAVAVAGIVLVGVFLDWSYPYAAKIPLVGDLEGSVRAAWRKVYKA